MVLELERIAETLPQIKAPMAASLFAQAAQAWIRAGNRSARSTRRTKG